MEPTSKQGCLVATGYIPANTIVAFYRLMPSNVDPVEAEQLWKRVQTGDFDKLLKQLNTVKPAKKVKKKWDESVACVNDAECFQKIRKLYADYTLDPFLPDLSYGIAEDGVLKYGLDPITFSLPFLNGATYTAIFPPLNGIFANEPAEGSIPNAEAIFPPELLELTSDKPTQAEAFTIYTPLVYIRTTQPVEEGEHITWCYGSEYTDRGYATPCASDRNPARGFGESAPSEMDLAGAGRGSPPDAPPGLVRAVSSRVSLGSDDTSERHPQKYHHPAESANQQPSQYVLDAIMVCFLLDISGRINVLKNSKIPDPAELRRLHEAASAIGETPSLTRPIKAIPSAGLSTIVIHSYTTPPEKNG